MAAKAMKQGADYMFPVKGNHERLLEDIEFLFQTAQKQEFNGVNADQYETLKKSHSRVERRVYCSIDASELPDSEKWTGIKSLGMVTRERTVKEKTSTEIIYYVSNCEVDAKLLAKCAREHWQVENSLH